MIRWLLILTFWVCCFEAKAQTNQYFFVLNNGQVINLDISNCSYTVIANNILVSDIAYCPDGFIYFILNTQLYKLDITTGLVVDSTAIPVSVDTGLACGQNNVLYFAGNDLYSLDLGTNVFSLIGAFPFQSLGDITVEGDSIFQIGVNGTPAVAISNISINPFALNYSCELPQSFFTSYSLVIENTTDCVDGFFEKNYILSDKNSLYYVNPTTCEFSLICSLPDTSLVFFGGASTSETIDTCNTVIPPPPPIDPILIDSLTYPNFFSPNADLLNAFFVPFQNPDSTAVTNTQIAIYNRWGNVIFETSNVFTGWNGKTPNGQDAAEGVYYWIVSYTNTKGKKTQVGTVTLLR